jgi:N-acetylglucosamine kinase-like BadF-type ATPase
MGYLLGIDGGGTRTTAWLADERGRVLGRAESGPSNPLKVGFEPAQREILCAIRGAFRAAATGLKPAKTLAVVIGLAGTDRPPVHRRLLRWLKRHVPAGHHLLTSDAAIALAAAIGDKPGIIVVSGTGSIAFARDRSGRSHRSGGWGTLFDDAGSGFDIGRKAIAAGLRALDGRGRPTRLIQPLCRTLGIRSLTEVVWKPPSPKAMAALFPAVLQAARFGDRVAREILNQAGNDLADLALALARRLRWRRKEIMIVCSGGIFQASSLVRKEFVRSIHREYPRARIVLLRKPPVVGAIAIARELANRG